VFCERYFYYHWELVTVERPLDLPVRCPISPNRWPQVHVTPDLLPAFEKYFSEQLPAIRGLLEKGCRGYAHIEEDGNVIVMMWVNEGDYYDDQLYRCWIHVPEKCMYIFAGECAKPFRSSGITVLIQKLAWSEYLARGYKTSRAIVNMHNQPALKYHVRLGYEEVGESIHVYCLFRCLHFHRRETYTQPRLLHLRKQLKTKNISESSNFQRQ
jgi:L-amino acid N-acyltransferase YncA